MPRGPAKKKTEDTSHQSLESKLWATADKLRGHLDAADYKHVVLGLIFPKYISDRFAQRHSEILGDGSGAEPENREHKIGCKQVHADFAFYESIQKNHSTIIRPYFTLTTLFFTLDLFKRGCIEMIMRTLGFTLVGILFITNAMAATQTQDVSKMVVADRAAARIARIASHTSNPRLRAQEFEKLVDGERNGNPSLTYGLAKYYREKWQIYKYSEKIGGIPSPLMNKIYNNLSNKYHLQKMPSEITGESSKYRKDRSYYLSYIKYVQKAAAENDTTAEASLANAYFWEPMRTVMLNSYMTQKNDSGGNAGTVTLIMSEHAVFGKVWAIMLKKSKYWEEKAIKQESPRSPYQTSLYAMFLRKDFNGIEANNGFYCPELSNSVHQYTGIINISPHGGFIKSAKLGNVTAMYTVMCHFANKTNRYFLFKKLKTRLDYKNYGPNSMLDLLDQSRTPEAFCAAMK